MSKEAVIKKLASNIPACWLAWEVQNLRKTFEDQLDDFSIKTEASSAKHTMYDTLENMTSSILQIIGYDKDEQLKVWDEFEELDILLAKDKDGVHKFIIS